THTCYSPSLRAVWLTCSYATHAATTAVYTLSLHDALPISRDTESSFLNRKRQVGVENFSRLRQHPTPPAETKSPHHVEWWGHSDSGYSAGIGPAFLGCRCFQDRQGRSRARGVQPPVRWRTSSSSCSWVMCLRSAAATRSGRSTGTLMVRARSPALTIAACADRRPAITSACSSGASLRRRRRARA